METYDCVVVGAGIFGLAAAKQYRFTRPDHSIRIFSSEATIGGTWSDERLYPGLKTNNQLGTFEYPDFPMDPERFGVKLGQHIPGPRMHAYLKAYADDFGISEHIRFRTKVAIAEHLEGEKNPQGGWILTVIDMDKEQEQSFKVHARRLIIASGLTSEPRMPSFNGQETFGRRIFHSKTFKQNSDTLRTSSSVTILGGNKSSWDAVDAYVRAGVHVDWVIRSTGNGPCWMAPPLVTPLKRWIETLSHTRLLTWFSPCAWNDDGGFTGICRLLHGTLIGRLLVNLFWAIMNWDICTLNGYDSHPKTALLKPRYPIFFSSPQLSILNYDSNFFELVKSDRVSIHVAEIDCLSPGRVHLSNGTSFESDMLMANCGWKNIAPVQFLPEGIEAELGLPHQQTANAVPDDLGNRTDLHDRADREILKQFPTLEHNSVFSRPTVSPTTADESKEAVDCEPLTMTMLYRFMVPPTERFLRHRDLAFCGLVTSLKTLVEAHLQGLWIGSYFDGRLAQDPSHAIGDAKAMESLQFETVLHNRFCRWRYPFDHSHPALMFESVAYWDMLMRGMGLHARRKQKEGLIAEITKPYWPSDYSHVNHEWERRHRADRKL